LVFAQCFLIKQGLPAFYHQPGWAELPLSSVCGHSRLMQTKLPRYRAQLGRQYHCLHPKKAFVPVSVSVSASIQHKAKTRRLLLAQPTPAAVNANYPGSTPEGVSTKFVQPYLL